MNRVLDRLVRLAQRTRDVRARWLPAGSMRRRAFDLGARVVVARLPADRWPGSPAARAKRAAEYQIWLERNAIGPAELDRLRSDAEGLPYRPLVSVLTPVYDVDEAWLRRCVESVREQIYDAWELCLVDDGSQRPHVARLLRDYAARDRRIRIERLEKNAGIVAASARALAMAGGTYVALLDHDDELSPDALYRVVKLLADRPELDLVYSDEDKIDEQGHRSDPFFKPDWSPNLLLSMNYVSHLSVLRRKLLDEAGGFRPGFDGSQDYDLLLRLTERTNHIAHVPHILYHWRKLPGSAAAVVDAKPYAFASARKALAEALGRRGADGKVEMTRPGLYSIRYAIQGSPLVSIIIPTRDNPALLRAAIESIERQSTWKRRELIVVDNGSRDPRTLEYLGTLEPRGRVLRHPGAFNWSTINNMAAQHASGEFLLFLNDDVEVIAPDWIEAMVEHAQRLDVGAVGAKLLYPTRTIQHAGVVLGVGGVANHGFRHFPADDDGYFGLPLVIHDCSAVTGACMMVRASLFREMGGFAEALGIAFNDIDFCLRARALGLSVVYTPAARLFHHESASREPGHTDGDEQFMWKRWGSELWRDPFYNPNLNVMRGDYGLRL